MTSQARTTLCFNLSMRETHVYEKCPPTTLKGRRLKMKTFTDPTREGLKGHVSHHPRLEPSEASTVCWSYTWDCFLWTTVTMCLKNKKFWEDNVFFGVFFQRLKTTKKHGNEILKLTNDQNADYRHQSSMERNKHPKPIQIQTKDTDSPFSKESFSKASS